MGRGVCCRKGGKFHKQGGESPKYRIDDQSSKRQHQKLKIGFKPNFRVLLTCCSKLHLAHIF